jgi:hypothetical protein
MGKKSRQKAKVERGKLKKAAAGGSREVDSVELARRLAELAERDPAAAGRFIAETLLEVGADLDSPYAHFIASTWPHFVRLVDGSSRVNIFLTHITHAIVQLHFGRTKRFVVFYGRVFSRPYFRLRVRSIRLGVERV